MKNYMQCRLEKGIRETTRWIEVRAAKLGAEVEVLPDRELWTVARVYDGVVMREDQLKEMQLSHRGSLPSVEPMPRG